MRRVIALELVGLKKLGCDLYDEFGNIVYKKGTDFTAEIFMQLSHSKIFKRDEEPLEFLEAAPLTVNSDPEVKIPEPMILKEKTEYKSVVTDDRKEKLVNSVKDVLYSAINKTPLKLRTCVDATEIILEEVYDKLQKVNNFEELRIHDYYTFSHSINVAIISAIIGKEIGFNENKVKDLTFSAFIHDIGKMQVPKSILYKPGPLTPEETNIIQKHSEYGYDFATKHLNLPEELSRVALEHHERWEGNGYPNRLKGDQISKYAQIVAIADVYDALVSEKIYKGSMQSIEAIKTLLTEEEKSFNPEILNKFVYMAVIRKEKDIQSLL